MNAVNEYVTRQPHPRLRPFVSGYSGYRMSGFDPGIHMGLPSGSLTMIVSFDDRCDVEDGHRGKRGLFWSLLGGLHSSPAVIRHQGVQHGLQLEITPRGANALFGVPASDLATQVVHLDAVAPTFATELIDRASEAATWRTRWAVLDEIFLRVLDLERELPAELEQAWVLLTTSYGSMSMGDIAAEIGWSRRHFTKKFNDHYGLTPKTMARVLRFERAQRFMRLPTRPSLGSVAALCGYADQAHMTREWVEFAGSAPSLWLADESLPTIDDPSLQDPTN